MSAAFSEWVRQKCPTLPSTPATANSSHCVGVGHVQNHRASGIDRTDTVMPCQATITAGLSRRVSSLVNRNDSENTGAEASITSEYQSPVPARRGPTTIITPQNPTIAATQRSQRIFSPSR